MFIDPDVQSAVIQTLSEKLTAHYVFPEIGEQIAAHIQRCLEEGAYAQISDGEQFASTLTAHLREVNQDGHLSVFFRPEPLPEREGPPDPQEMEKWRQWASFNNFGLQKVERLEGNVGYLDIRGFAYPAWGGDTAAAALNFLAHTDALIIDLRKNGGGHPGMVAFICSYLFGDEPVHLNTFYWRGEEPPIQSWTQAYVPGRRYGDKPIYVLTSHETFSGGEEFAYNLKTRQRATLIGAVTGGGAHPVRAYRIHAHFEAGIPGGRPVSPITGTNWEGLGVTPDIPVDPQQALDVAYRLALQSVIERIGEAESGPFKYLKEQAQTALAGLDEQDAPA